MDNQTLAKPDYTWFYVGVLLTALLGSNSLGMQDMPYEVKWLVIAIAAAYSIVLPRVMKLGLAIGITVLLAVAGLLATIAMRSFSQAKGIDPNTQLFTRSVAYGALLFKTATLLMWIGVIFHGISKFIKKRRVSKRNL